MGPLFSPSRWVTAAIHVRAEPTAGGGDRVGTATRTASAGAGKNLSKRGRGEGHQYPACPVACSQGLLCSLLLSGHVPTGEATQVQWASLCWLAGVASEGAALSGEFWGGFSRRTGSESIYKQLSRVYTGGSTRA